ncbi:MAG TPA: MIP/aquaporin family protein [Rhodanobacteraceae bacterium]|jgi:glycerol uptake facilitator-like aquaporin|nr:MIP/aquaporin family protein [Rhodanobacteraceae bacterium]
MSLGRRAIAEAVATAFLLSIIVGSGVMGERLAGGNVAIALLANSLATGCGLAALIVTFAPISGAHMNPAVTLALAARGDHAWRDVPAYLAAQLAGAVAGVWLAHAMFAMPIFEHSTKARAGIPQMVSECVATFGLLVVVLRGSRHRPDTVPWTVACYITAAYWFTASTSFANPAVTIARSMTESFAGIDPADVPGFCAAQLAGVALAVGFDRVAFATK